MAYLINKATDLFLVKTFKFDSSGLIQLVPKMSRQDQKDFFIDITKLDLVMEGENMAHGL